MADLPEEAKERYHNILWLAKTTASAGPIATAIVELHHPEIDFLDHRSVICAGEDGDINGFGTSWPCRT